MKSVSRCRLVEQHILFSRKLRRRTGSRGSEQRVYNGRVTVSKTDFTNWMTCPGYAWVLMHQPDLAPPDDAPVLRRQETGNQVEALARQMFPDGVLIDTLDTELASRWTAEAMQHGERVLFQGTVRTARGLLARADVLVREPNGWHVIEIKSSAADPVKPRSLVRKYLPDVSFQTIACEEAGIPISRSSLLHVNKRYRRNGDVLPGDLLALTDVTKDVAKARTVMMAAIEDALACLQDHESAALCDCDRKTRANRCDLFDHFHPGIPVEGTIYHITGIHRNSLLPALDRNVIQLTDWPDDLALSQNQRRQVEVARSGEEIVQTDEIAGFLGRLRFPLSFLDYETFQQPVPPWDGYTPHQQIPFQYSLHTLTEDFSMMHTEYLCLTREDDPVPELLRRLREDMSDKGSVIVWNQGFEEGRNTEMSALEPDFAAFLGQVNGRMVDLADIVSKGWWLHPVFGGRWSLKSVLPVAAPELRYDALEIGDGGTASERWMQCMVDPVERLSEAERAGIIGALRQYCHLDTLAMVRVWEHMLDLVTR